MTILQSNALLIEEIELTEEEVKEAILEGKRKKYFKLKHKDYWELQEHGNTKLHNIDRGRENYL